MGRPLKRTIDYFPHDTDASERNTVFILESNFGNNGYAFWFKLLEILGKSEGQFLDLNNENKLIFLAAKTHISTEETRLILNLLSKLGAIDPELWSKNIVWCQNFVDRIEDAYRLRKQKKPEKPVSSVETIVSSVETAISSEESAQIKLNEIKLNKKKLKEEDICDIKGVLHEVKKKTSVIFDKNDVSDFREYFQRIFDHWNTKNIIVHRLPTKEMVSALREWWKQGIDVEQTIDSYAAVIKSPDTYWTYEWTLQMFLKRGAKQFLDLTPEKALENFKQKQKELKYGTNRTAAGGYRDPDLSRYAGIAKKAFPDDEG